MDNKPTLVDRMKSAHIDNLAKDIVSEERRLKELEHKISLEYPEAKKELDELRNGWIDIEDRRKELKEALINAEDYDVHEVDGHRFSLTKVVKMKVKDIDEVEPDFKQVMEVADEKRAAKYYKLYGEPPKGFEDNSYTKINWKEL